MATITPVTATVKSEDLMQVCCDVSKEKIDVYSRVGHEGALFEMMDTIRNCGSVLQRQLKAWQELAQAHGHAGVLVVCEPTGGHERKLLALARQAGSRTAYVSGEAVGKARVIESNDTGKTDRKDARIIATLAGMGKTLKVRQLPDEYERLRELNTTYELECTTVATIRNHMHDQVRQLFPDLDGEEGFIFSATGRAIYQLFGLNPARIRECSWREFVAKVKTFVKAARIERLEKVWAAAASSLLHQCPATVRAMREERLGELFEDLDRHLGRKLQLRTRILDAYGKTEESRKLADIPDASSFQLARVIAESGPLADFRHGSQLLRYFGMNIRERQSGKWTGKNRISKKGRALGRKVLYQLVFSSLIGEGKLFADPYRRKKADCACGMKAIVCLMRKALKMILGVFRSREEFSRDRVFASLPAAA